METITNTGLIATLPILLFAVVSFCLIYHAKKKAKTKARKKKRFFETLKIGVELWYLDKGYEKKGKCRDFDEEKEVVYLQTQNGNIVVDYSDLILVKEFN